MRTNVGNSTCLLLTIRLSLKKGHKLVAIASSVEYINMIASFDSILEGPATAKESLQGLSGGRTALPGDRVARYTLTKLYPLCSLDRKLAMGSDLI
jgi:hypothetical protein